MKVNINGVTRDMTPEEEAQFVQEMANMPQSEPDPNEVRMNEIEAALIELAALMTGGM